MKNEKIEQAISKHIESKVLVLMSYPAEYIEDVKTDMACAFRKGAEWMAGQGESRECTIGMATEEIHCHLSEEALERIGVSPGDKVVVQIRKKQ